jgi:hypothetical protein
MNYSFPLCSIDPSSHSLVKIKETDVCIIFYSCPSEAKLYFDSDGIIGNGMMRGCCQMCKGSGLYAGAASGRGLGSVAGMPPMRGIGKKFVNVSKKLMGGELQALASQPMAANYAFRYAR